MKILVASSYLPWPLTDGGRVAQYRTFEALQGAGTFTLLVPVHNPQEEADARIVEEKLPHVTVETVRCFVAPPPRTGRDGLRRLAGMLLRAAFPASKAVPEPVAAPRDASPEYPLGVLYPKFVSAVDRHLDKGYDIFQAEFAEMMTLGLFVEGRAPSVFVNHQLHFVYAQRFMLANNVNGANARYLTQRVVHEEPAYLAAFDSVIVFSEVDRDSLLTLGPALTVAVSPFPSPTASLSAPVLFDQPVTTFVFVASQHHRPNADGLSWFMKDVWPDINRRVPKAVIEVIGKWSAEGQAEIPNHADIHFLGFVEDLEAALTGKIMIVPLWIGSGIRTKILAAWGSSCPVISTVVGAEGLPGTPGEHYLVADDAPAFADACVALAGDVGELNRISGNALELVQEKFSLSAVKNTRLAIYEQLMAKTATAASLRVGGGSVLQEADDEIAR